VRPDGDLVAGVRPRRGAQDEVEDVLRVDGQAADLGRVHGLRARDVAGLLPVAEERQRDDVGRGEVDGVPFEDHRGLGGVAAAQLRGRRGFGAEGGVDLVLQPAEGELGRGLGGGVAGYRDVDYGAGGDVGWEEDGGEFDLVRRWVSFVVLSGRMGKRACGPGYQSFVRCEQDCYAGVDFADCEGDEHGCGVPDDRM
jgi:hypothetical protein